MCNLTRTTIVLLLLLGTTNTLFSDDSLNITQLSTLYENLAWGTPYDLARRGNIVYVATNNGLHVVDISDRSYPVEISSISESSRFYDIVVRDSLAFLGGDPNLTIISIANPYNLRVVGSWDAIGERATKLEVIGNHVLLPIYDDGIYVIDISTPSEPVEVNHTRIENFWFLESASFGQFVYLFSEYIPGAIVDMNDPENPVIHEHSLRWSFPAKNTVIDHFLYVIRNHGVVIYDLSDPLNPVEVEIPDLIDSGNVISVAADGDYLYLYVENWNVWANVIGVYSISNPIEPTLLHLESVHPGYDDEVSLLAFDGLLLQADNVEGLRLYGTRIEGVLESIGWYQSFGGINSIEVVDEFAYLNQGSRGMCVVDLQNPGEPEEVHTSYPNTGRLLTNFPNNNLNFDLENQKSITVSYSPLGQNVQIHDISDFAEPELYSSFYINWVQNTPEIAGEKVFLINRDQELLVYDISNRLNPVLQYEFVDWEYVAEMEIHEDILFLYCCFQGNERFIKFYDFSERDNLEELGRIQIDGPVENYLIDQNRLFVLTDSNLVFYDISNLQEPRETGHLDDLAWDLQFDVQDDVLFISDNSEGISLYNIETPSSPELIGYYNSPDHFFYLNAFENCLAVTYDSHLMILDCSEAIESVKVPESSISIPTSIEVGSAYPNPFNSLFNIQVKLSNSQVVKLELTNLLGQTVYSEHQNLNQGVTRLTVDSEVFSENLVCGNYILNVKSETGTTSQRVTLLK
ncbi:T9SS type A sorting domain-containing protein [bacterium]|nr:T9SS type A sorting domain-containing protein [bacterium]